MNKKKLLLVLLISILISCTLLFIAQKRSPSSDGVLKLSGNIEAHESVVSFKIPGRVAELACEEGSHVTAGALLAKLEQSDYRQQVDIDQATVAMRDAELRLATSGSRLQEKKSAEQALLDSQATLELATADNQRYQTLFEKGEVPAQTSDAYSANLKRAQSAYERARQNLNMIAEGVRAEQIAIHKAALHSALQTLELAKIRLGYTSLYAPFSGVALVRHTERGEVVAAGTPVVTIADLDHLWLRAYVSETDVGRITLGQKVQVKSDTFPSKSYPGKVSYISSQAEFTPKSVETHKERVTLVYRVKIDLENSSREFKPGMPADAYLDLSPHH